MASLNPFLIMSYFLLFLSLSSSFHFSVYNYTGIQFPSISQTTDDCKYSKLNQKINQNLKLHLKHTPFHHPNTSKSDSLLLAARKDLARIQTIHPNKTAKFNTYIQPKTNHTALTGQLVATLESGVPLGSGEYFIDVFIGTPAVHTRLILDTGSDLNWLQCVPCHDCFDQHGPLFNPSSSSSYEPITCGDPRCSLVTSPEPSRTCKKPSDPCRYFYWYGDQSNTTGDLALETFTVNLTSRDSHRVDEVIFGCGHRNRGLFHGAAGLLGLGRGPLSFASQLKDLYGHTFSYCLVDRNSDLSVSSKLIFGEDQRLVYHPNLNYTSFVNTNANAVDTFYYVQVKGIKVGGEMLKIPKETWELEKDGSGGTIVDSGTTLSYFGEPAYELVREAFLKKVKYPVVEDFPVLSPCFNVSGVEDVVMPGLGIVFGDGGAWDFPTQNYFIRLDPEGIMCLAILGSPNSRLSIIGNYQQQNFHMLYDMGRLRLGFAPMRCAEV